MTAELIRHEYSSGTAFWTVECAPCRVVLNSGHHYREPNLHHAEALADRHNADNHAPVLATMDDAALAFTAKLAAGVMAAGLPVRRAPVAELLRECAGRLENLVEVRVAEDDNEGGWHSFDEPPYYRKQVGG